MAARHSLRIVSFGASTVLIGLAAFAAFSTRITAIEDLFADAPVTDILSEPVRDRPLPPPPKIKPPEPPPQQQVVTNPTLPPTPWIDPISTEPVQPVGPREIVGARWVRQPSGAEFETYYPERALERGRSGQVVLDCIVGAHGEIACSVISETPQGWGFGNAALQISRYFEMSPQLADGQPTAGGRVRVPIAFRTE